MSWQFSWSPLLLLQHTLWSPDQHRESVKPGCWPTYTSCHSLSRTHTHTHAHMHTYTNIHKHTHTHTCTHTHKHTFINNTHTHTHAHKHTFISTHTDTNVINVSGHTGEANRRTMRSKEIRN